MYDVSVETTVSVNLSANFSCQSWVLRTFRVCLSSVPFIPFPVSELLPVPPEFCKPELPESFPAVSSSAIFTALTPFWGILKLMTHTPRRISAATATSSRIHNIRFTMFYSGLLTSDGSRDHGQRSENSVPASLSETGYTLSGSLPDTQAYE